MATKFDSGHSTQRGDRDINHRTVSNYGAINNFPSSMSSSTSLTTSLSHSSSQSLLSCGRMGSNTALKHDKNNDLQSAVSRNESACLLHNETPAFGESIQRYERRIRCKERREKMRQIGKSALFGGFVGGCIALLAMVALSGSEWLCKLRHSRGRCNTQTCPAVRGQPQKESVFVDGIQTYLDLFDWRRQRRMAPHIWGI